MSRRLAAGLLVLALCGVSWGDKASVSFGTAGYTLGLLADRNETIAADWTWTEGETLCWDFSGGGTPSSYCMKSWDSTGSLNYGKVFSMDPTGTTFSPISFDAFARIITDGGFRLRYGSGSSGYEMEKSDHTTMWRWTPAFGLHHFETSGSEFRIGGKYDSGTRKFYTRYYLDSTHWYRDDVCVDKEGVETTLAQVKVSNDCTSITYPFPRITSVPPTRSTPCTPGQIAYDATYFYICYATDSWRRAAVASW